jgi:hypothetical protein
LGKKALGHLNNISLPGRHQGIEGVTKIMISTDFDFNKNDHSTLLGNDVYLTHFRKKIISRIWQPFFFKKINAADSPSRSNYNHF